MKYYAIIVAGGSGSRMKSAVPKQFLLLNQRPVLMHTIEAFYYSDVRPEIIVALNEKDWSYWQELVQHFNFTVPHQLIPGGLHRFDSVKNCLENLEDTSIVAVHDAVRPVISNTLITKSFQHAELNGTAICAVQSRDSIRQVIGNSSRALKRDEIFLVQTPQVFQCLILRTAYETAFDESFTDDASVVEKSGIEVQIIEGERSNIKITFPEDLSATELWLKKNPA